MIPGLIPAAKAWEQSPPSDTGLTAQRVLPVPGDGSPRNVVPRVAPVDLVHSKL